MKSIYKQLELVFEKLVNLALKIYGSSITFILAVACVIIFISNPVFYRQNMHDIIRDLFLCITFLSFFIIQKAFNKYTAAIHIKMNELVSAHDKASNEIVNIEEKTEEELKELAKNYDHGSHNKDPGKEQPGK